MKKLNKALLGLGVSAAMFGSLAANADTLKIALAGPVTGDVAQYGDMQNIGALMAIEQINKAGGVKGMKLEGVVYDDSCDPKQAVQVANKVVNDGIKFVVGHLCSSSTQPASDIYEDEGVLMITAASTSPDITARGHKMIFRTIGLDSHQGPTAGNYIADTLKPKRMAVIHDKQQYGEGIATAVKDTVTKKGVNVVLFEGINKGDKDFSALIAKLQKENIDFVYYGGYHPELGLILRQAAEKGFNVKFMGPEGVGNSDLSSIAGAAAENLLVTLPPSFDTRAENKALVDAFKAKGQDPSGAFVLTAYSAVQVMADAIKASGTTDTQKLQHTLREMTFNTPTGNIAFDAKGDLKTFDFVIYQWHQDGSKTLLK
ncbi:MAG: branched-chain amino acid ABC transporter substrate-binding protein [Hahellaceae bacterium]|nr:branched-chain amino acid ABC transporter substrate-binding protein [Hahellaceae bacterium]